jgi:hypothetical protein
MSSAEAFPPAMILDKLATGSIIKTQISEKAKYFDNYSAWWCNLEIRRISMAELGHSLCQDREIPTELTNPALARISFRLSDLHGKESLIE